MKRVILFLGLLILLMGVASAEFYHVAVNGQISVGAEGSANAIILPGITHVAGDGSFEYDADAKVINLYDDDLRLKVSGLENDFVLNGYTTSNIDNFELAYSTDGYLSVSSVFNGNIQMVSYEKKSFMFFGVNSNEFQYYINLNSYDNRDPTLNQISFVSNVDNLVIDSIGYDLNNKADGSDFNTNALLNKGDKLTLTLNGEIIDGKIQLSDDNVKQYPIEVCGGPLYALTSGNYDIKYLDQKTNFEFTMSNVNNQQTCKINRCEYSGIADSYTEVLLGCDVINSNVETPIFKIINSKDVTGLVFENNKWECKQFGCISSADFDLYPFGLDKGYFKIKSSKFKSLVLSQGISEWILNADEFYLGSSTITSNLILLSPYNGEAKLYLNNNREFKISTKGGDVVIPADSENSRRRVHLEENIDNTYNFDVVDGSNPITLNYIDCCNYNTYDLNSKNWISNYPAGVACKYDSDTPSTLFSKEKRTFDFEGRDTTKCSTGAVIEPASQVVVPTVASTTEDCTAAGDFKCGDCCLSESENYFEYFEYRVSGSIYYFDTIAHNDLSLRSDGKLKTISDVKDICSSVDSSQISCSKGSFVTALNTPVVTTATSAQAKTSLSACGSTPDTSGWGCDCPMEAYWPPSNNVYGSSTPNSLSRIQLEDLSWTALACDNDPECTRGLCSVGEDAKYYCCKNTPPSGADGEVNFEESISISGRDSGSYSICCDKYNDGIYEMDSNCNENGGKIVASSLCTCDSRIDGNFNCIGDDIYSCDNDKWIFEDTCSLTICDNDVAMVAEIIGEICPELNVVTVSDEEQDLCSTIPGKDNLIGVGRSNSFSYSTNSKAQFGCSITETGTTPIECINGIWEYYDDCSKGFVCQLTAFGAICVSEKNPGIIATDEAFVGEECFVYAENNLDCSGEEVLQCLDDKWVLSEENCQTEESCDDTVLDARSVSDMCVPLTTTTIPAAIGSRTCILGESSTEGYVCNVEEGVFYTSCTSNDQCIEYAACVTSGNEHLNECVICTVDDYLGIMNTRTDDTFTSPYYGFNLNKMGMILGVTPSGEYIEKSESCSDYTHIEEYTCQMWPDNHYFINDAVFSCDYLSSKAFCADGACVSGTCQFSNECPRDYVCSSQGYCIVPSCQDDRDCSELNTETVTYSCLAGECSTTATSYTDNYGFGTRCIASDDGSQCASGLVCSEGSCVECSEGFTSSCGDYECDYNSGKCNTECTSNSDCKIPYSCDVDNNICVSCSDTDEDLYNTLSGVDSFGIKYAKKGFVSGVDKDGQLSEASDYCISDYQIREYFCDKVDNRWIVNNIDPELEGGEYCLDGVIIWETSNPCTVRDSLNGYACNVDEGTFYTSCISNDECSLDASCVTSQGIPNSGNCIVCYDSDGVNDYMTQGYVSGVYLLNGFGQYKKEYDVCTGEGDLQQSSCSPGRDGHQSISVEDLIDCSDVVLETSYCLDGACVENEQFGEAETESGIFGVENAPEKTSFWSRIFKVDTSKAKELFSY